MRLFVQIAYKGTNYQGWQRQRETSNTVQQVIEDSLIRVLKCQCYVSGCGRTDSGVHASSFFFHIDLKEAPGFDLCERMNRVLPKDIVFVRSFEVDPKMNARFMATSRVYNYYFHLNHNPFEDDMSTYVDFPIDASKISQALKILEQRSDFKYLCKQPDKHKTTICHINYIKLFTNKELSHFRLEFSANRFLKNMIRMIVARLFEISKGKLSLLEFEKLLDGEQTLIVKPAYPQGLFLTQVNYDFFDSKHFQNSILPHPREWILYDK